MNTVAIKKADRLTETEVHAAIEDMLTAGEKPTALNLLRTLGRGSLTTITRYLQSFNQANAASEAETHPPALMEIPRELGASGELLIKKIWSDARRLAVQEFEGQRAALALAEENAKARIAEAMEFSELQAKQLEELETTIEEFKALLDDKELLIHALRDELKASNENWTRETAEKTIIAHDLAHAQESLAKAENNVETLQSQLTAKEEEMKGLVKSSRDLDMQVNKQQMALDQQDNTIKGLRGELIEAQRTCKEAEKKAAELVGMLTVYEKLQPKTINKKPKTENVTN